MRAVIDGPIGQEMLDMISASSARLVGLGWMDGGSLSLHTKKPVRKPENPKGMKIRMMGNPLFVDTMSAMGGSDISMGYGEVFTAIQAGVVDGAENTPLTLYTANHCQAGTRFYTQTRHLIVPEIFVMSKLTWDKLSKDDRALMKKFARVEQLEQRALWNKRVADYSAKLKSAGIEFIAIDSKPFHDATAPVRAKHGTKHGAKHGAQHADLIKRIEAVKQAPPPRDEAHRPHPP